MADQVMSLAEKIDLLFETVKQADGRRLTYEGIQSISGIRPSTISRMRSGQNVDPSFRTVTGLAKAFGVPLAYFSREMTRPEAQAFLADLQQQERQVRQAEQARQETAELLALLATRASHMDTDTISVLREMVEYVIKQQGIQLDRPQPPEHPASAQG